MTGRVPRLLKMADEANVIDLVETTEPSMDSSVGENDDVVLKLHAEIDNLNIVLDHLERKNGDIYSRIEKLLASIQSNKPEEE